MAYGRWPALAARVDVVYGSADQFLDEPVLAAWAKDAATDVHAHCIADADHFFGGRWHDLGRLVSELP